MARHNTGRVTLAQLIEGGLGQQAAWITEEFRGPDEFRRWMETRHPNITQQTLLAAWRWVRFARDAAEQSLNRNVRPPLATVPIDPTIPANRGFRYELEVRLVDPDPARRGGRNDRSQSFFWVYHTNELQTLEQLQRNAPRSILQRMQRAAVNRRDRSPLPQGWEEFSVELTVRTVSRRGS